MTGIQGKRHAAEPRLSACHQEQMALTVASLRSELLTHDPDLEHDEDLWRDLLEGETDALEMIRALARAALEAKGRAEQARERKTEIAARQARFEARAERLRTAAYAMMDLAGLTRLPGPDLHIGLERRPACLEIEEGELPGDFMDVEVAVRKVPNKRRIEAALEAGQAVPGARMMNSPPVLVIRKS